VVDVVVVIIVVVDDVFGWFEESDRVWCDCNSRM
jgi:hypothetical protein